MRASRDELIAFLQALPVDVILEVTCEEEHNWSTRVTVEDLDLNPDTGNVEFIDLRGNPLVPVDSPNYNKTFLKFGGFVV